MDVFVALENQSWKISQAGAHFWYISRKQNTIWDNCCSANGSLLPTRMVSLFQGKLQNLSRDQKTIYIQGRQTVRKVVKISCSQRKPVVTFDVAYRDQNNTCQEMAIDFCICIKLNNITLVPRAHPESTAGANYDPDGTKEKLWTRSYSETERKCVQSMPERNRMCLKVVKAISGLSNNPLNALSTYVYKTVMMLKNQSLTHRCGSQSQLTFILFRTFLKDVWQYLESGYLPFAFDQEFNVLKEANSQKIEQVKNYLTAILQRSDDILLNHMIGQ